MMLCAFLLVSSAHAFGFDFGDMFDQAFGGAGGGMRFQMGGGRPRMAQFPRHIRQEIAEDFAWLKGTEWTMSNKVVIKFTVDGFVLTNNQECVHPQQCLWSAYDGQINVAMLQSGLFTFRPDSVPASTAAEDVTKVTISGKREADKQSLALKFVRIFDMTSREDAMDLYAVLGVEPDASTADIKKAYRRLTVAHHPDQNQGDANAQAKFNEITKASEILSDSVKRMLYDTGGMEAIRAMDRGEIQRGQDALLEIGVPLSVLFTGGTVSPIYRRRVVCTGCRVNPRLERCRACTRCPSEIRLVNQQVGPGFFVQQQVQVDSKEYCKFEEKPLEISVKKGARAGEDILIEAMADQRPGLIPGNVIVRIKQLPDKRFVREGHNLKTTLTVGLREALLGFTHDVELPDSTLVPITTTSVTQPGQVIRVAGEGMPIKDDSDRRGDLIVTVAVQLPVSLTSEQKTAVASLFEQTAKADTRADEL